jgi:hypothetical protein
MRLYVVCVCVCVCVTTRTQSYFVPNKFLIQSLERGNFFFGGLLTMSQKSSPISHVSLSSASDEEELPVSLDDGTDEDEGEKLVVSAKTKAKRARRRAAADDDVEVPADEPVRFRPLRVTLAQEQLALASLCALYKTMKVPVFKPEQLKKTLDAIVWLRQNVTRLTERLASKEADYETRIRGRAENLEQQQAVLNSAPNAMWQRCPELLDYFVQEHSADKAFLAAEAEALERD